MQRRELKVRVGTESRPGVMKLDYIGRKKEGQNVHIAKAEL